MPRDRLVAPGPPPLQLPNADGGNWGPQSPVLSFVNSVNSVSCSSSNPNSLESFSSTSGASYPQSSLHVPSDFVVDRVICPLRPPSVVSPINVEKLAAELSHHPDQQKVDFVIAGLRQGFRVGFNASRVSLRAASGNMPSALLQPSVIDDYLRNELDMGRIAGPFRTPPLPNLHVSRFGVIPKKHQPGKWRLILDLSSPRELVLMMASQKKISVQYMKIDAIINGIMTRGRGTLMAKFDVRCILQRGHSLSGSPPVGNEMARAVLY